MTKAELMGGRGAARLALASGRQHPHFPRDVLIALEKKKKKTSIHIAAFSELIFLRKIRKGFSSASLGHSRRLWTEDCEVRDEAAVLRGEEADHCACDGDRGEHPEAEPPPPPPILKTRPLPRSQPELPALFGNTNSLVCCVLCFLNFVPRAAPARSRGR